MPTRAVHVIVMEMSFRAQMHAGERAIKRGREWCVVGSDYAQATNPTPSEALDQ